MVKPYSIYCIHQRVTFYLVTAVLAASEMEQRQAIKPFLINSEQQVLGLRRKHSTYQEMLFLQWIRSYFSIKRMWRELFVLRGQHVGSNTSILKRRFLVLRPQEPGSFQKETVPPRGEPSCPRQRGLWRWAEGRPPLPLTFTVKGDHHLPSAHPTPGIRDPNSLKNICGFRRLFFIVKLPRSSYHFRDEKKGS